MNSYSRAGVEWLDALRCGYDELEKNSISKRETNTKTSELEGLIEYIYIYAYYPNLQAKPSQAKIFLWLQVQVIGHNSCNLERKGHTAPHVISQVKIICRTEMIVVLHFLLGRHS